MVKESRSDSNSKATQRQTNQEDITIWIPKSTKSSRLPTNLFKERPPTIKRCIVTDINSDNKGIHQT